MYAPVPGASSGRTRVSVREDIVCIVDADVDVDDAAAAAVESGAQGTSSEDDAVKLETFDVACEEVGGGIAGDALDWPAPGEGEYLGFVNANRLFGFSFALRIATLLSSSVICY